MWSLERGLTEPLGVCKCEARKEDKTKLKKKRLSTLVKKLSIFFNLNHCVWLSSSQSDFNCGCPMVDNLEIPGDGLKNLIRKVLHFLIVLYQGQECGDI